MRSAAHHGRRRTTRSDAPLAAALAVLLACGCERPSDRVDADDPAGPDATTRDPAAELRRPSEVDETAEQRPPGTPAVRQPPSERVSQEEALRDCERLEPAQRERCRDLIRTGERLEDARERRDDDSEDLTADDEATERR